MASTNRWQRKLQLALRPPDAAMLHKLAELTGANFAQVASYCISDYLQQNYQRLYDFYSSAPLLEEEIIEPTADDEEHTTEHNDFLDQASRQNQELV